MKEEQYERAPSFLVKLLKILRSKQYAKIVGWDPEQKGIRIHNQCRFERQILPRYFRHNKVTSFIRQLNMYDFHKVYVDHKNSLFCHEIFNPRKKDSINSIKRKVYHEAQERYIPPSFSSQAQKQNKGPTKPPNEGQPRPPNEGRTKPSDEGSSQKKSSFKLLFKDSLRAFSNSEQQKEPEASTEHVLDQILCQIAPLRLSSDSIREKIEELRKHPKFRRHLKRGSFMCKVYAKLGIDMSEDNDKLSELSIEDELLIKNTRKSISVASLRMFESRALNMRDTIGMFLN